MNNVGFNYGAMGLQNMDRLADLENKKIWAQYENKMKESEAQNEAIGSLVGNVAGLGMAGYSEYQKGQEGTLKGVAEGTVNASREHQANRRAYDEAGIVGASSKTQAGIADAAAAEPIPQLEKTTTPYGMQNVSAERIKPTGPDYADYQLQDKDRRIVTLRSPTRSRLASTWNDTSDGFKNAFNSLLSGFPSNFIGTQS